MKRLDNIIAAATEGEANGEAGANVAGANAGVNVKHRQFPELAKACSQAGQALRRLREQGASPELIQAATEDRDRAKKALREAKASQKRAKYVEKYADRLGYKAATCA